MGSTDEINVTKSLRTTKKGASKTPPQDCQKKNQWEAAKDSSLVPAPLLTKTLWTRISRHKNDRERLLFVMRNAERIDRVFGADWQDTENIDGRFLPTDQNIPLTLRPLFEHTSMDLDPPITAMGKYTSQIVARAMQQRGCKELRIISSPALRCVQTAAAVATYFKRSFSIEPGLTEPLVWFLNGMLQPFHPSFVTPQTLSDLGLPVDLNYVPVLDTASLTRKKLKETENEALLRIKQTLQKLSIEHIGPLLIVGHACTQEVAVCMCTSMEDEETLYEDLDDSEEYTTEKEKSCEVDFHHLGLKYPYGSVVSLVRAGKKDPFRFHLLKDLIPPFTYSSHFSSQPAYD